jgi:hypothetical protein
LTDILSENTHIYDPFPYDCVLFALHIPQHSDLNLFIRKYADLHFLLKPIYIFMDFMDKVDIGKSPSSLPPSHFNGLARHAIVHAISVPAATAAKQSFCPQQC